MSTTTSTSSTPPVKKVVWKKSNKEIDFPILMYHHINTDTTCNSLYVPKEEFVAQMNALKKAGYYTLNTQEAFRVLEKNEKPEKKIVWVTLDDGYKDNYKNAFPILRKNQQKATINLITNPAYTKNKLTLKQIKKMKKFNIDFQSHTVSHLNLDELTDEQIKTELIDSKKKIDKELNQNTQMICYPAGHYDDRVTQVAAKAGYKIGLTTINGWATKSDGMFELPRVRVSPGMSGESLVAACGG
jgi:peptidoglycan/xylan/chitin deacetylase (PgdA/CDA1 family)